MIAATPKKVEIIKPLCDIDVSVSVIAILFFIVFSFIKKDTVCIPR